MAAHHGISPSVIEKNKLEPHVVGYIEQFNEIDEVSRITNMPRNEKIHSNKSKNGLMLRYQTVILLFVCLLF